jgi:DNA-binding NarL/FixJ family response regulator
MSIDHTSGHIEQANQVGASGYIVKAEAGDTLLRAIDAVVKNGKFFPGGDEGRS